jgi:hypothetical protein
VQGMGWTCLEELVWGDEEHKWLPPGVLHTRGPGESTRSSAAAASMCCALLSWHVLASQPGSLEAQTACALLHEPLLTSLQLCKECLRPALPHLHPSTLTRIILSTCTHRLVGAATCRNVQDPHRERHTPGLEGDAAARRALPPHAAGALLQGRGRAPPLPGRLSLLRSQGAHSLRLSRACRLSSQEAQMPAALHTLWH